METMNATENAATISAIRIAYGCVGRIDDAVYIQRLISSAWRDGNATDLLGALWALSEELAWYGWPAKARELADATRAAVKEQTSTGGAKEANDE